MKTILCFCFIVGSAASQTPMPLWTAVHPAQVSGIFVNETNGQIATACFDGNARIYSPSGGLLTTVDVSPGTLDQARNCVAYRLDLLTCGGANDYAIGIRDNGTVLHAADIGASNIVRDISHHARFAVTDERLCYNLVTGVKWPVAQATSWFFTPLCCAEDGTNVWTGGPDGYIRKWAPDGKLLFQKLLSPQGIFALDVDAAHIVCLGASNWISDIWLLDKAGNVLTRAHDEMLPAEVKFTLDGKVVYASYDRLICWDGFTLTATPTSLPPPPTKPGKKR